MDVSYVEWRHLPAIYIGGAAATLLIGGARGWWGGKIGVKSLSQMRKRGKFRVNRPL